MQWRHPPAPRRRWPPERAPVSFISLHFLVSLGVLSRCCSGFYTRIALACVLHFIGFYTLLLWLACLALWGFMPVISVAALACVPHSVGFYASSLRCCSGVRAPRRGVLCQLFALLLWRACLTLWGFMPVLCVAALACVPHSVGFYASSLRCCSGVRAPCFLQGLYACCFSVPTYLSASRGCRTRCRLWRA